MAYTAFLAVYKLTIHSLGATTCVLFLTLLEQSQVIISVLFMKATRTQSLEVHCSGFKIKLGCEESHLMTYMYN